MGSSSCWMTACRTGARLSKEDQVADIMKQIVVKLRPVVEQIVTSGSSGSLEHHFAGGQYRSTRIKELTL